MSPRELLLKVFEDWHWECNCHSDCEICTGMEDNLEERVVAQVDEIIAEIEEAAVRRYRGLPPLDATPVQLSPGQVWCERDCDWTHTSYDDAELMRALTAHLKEHRQLNTKGPARDVQPAGRWRRFVDRWIHWPFNAPPR